MKLIAKLKLSRIFFGDEIIARVGIRVYECRQKIIMDEISMYFLLLTWPTSIVLLSRFV